MDALRVLAVGDVHADTRLVERVRAVAMEKDVDLIILAGDVFTGRRIEEGVLTPLRGFPVALVPGNHDSHALLHALVEAYGWRSIHGRALRIGPAGFFGYSAVNTGGEAIPEEDIAWALLRAFEAVQDAPVRIMVTHVHPRGSVFDRLLGMEIGSRGVREVIERVQPDLVITAHVHEASGLEDRLGESRIVNVSRAIRVFDITPQGVRDA